MKRMFVAMTTTFLLLATPALAHAGTSKATDPVDAALTGTDITKATLTTKKGKATLKVTFNAPVDISTGSLSISGAMEFKGKPNRYRGFVLVALSGAVEKSEICDVNLANTALTRCSPVTNKISGNTVTLTTKVAKLFPKGVNAKKTKTFGWNAVALDVTSACGDATMCTDATGEKPIKHRI
jgi:hypothetical protein